MRADLAIVAAADPVDLLDQLPVLLHEPRVQPVSLLELLQIVHRHADVQIVGARLEDVAARARRLVGQDRIDLRIEEQRRQASDQRVERLARALREAARRGPRRRAPPRRDRPRVRRSRNLRAVMLLYGPVLIQNSFV